VISQKLVKYFDHLFRPFGLIASLPNVDRNRPSLAEMDRISHRRYVTDALAKHGAGAEGGEDDGI
jgi:hypothetical protein